MTDHHLQVITRATRMGTSGLAAPDRHPSPPHPPRGPHSPSWTCQPCNSRAGGHLRHTINARKRVADIEKEVADTEKEVADIAAKRAAINAESQRWPAYSPDHHHTTQDPNRHVATTNDRPTHQRQPNAHQQEVTVSLAFFSYRRGGWTPQPSTLSLSRDITPSQDGDQ